jgi:hypothetical protein
MIISASERSRSILNPIIQLLLMVFVDGAFTLLVALAHGTRIDQYSVIWSMWFQSPESGHSSITQRDSDVYWDDLL